MTEEFGDNVLDLRVARWRRDKVTCALLDAIERMSPDERAYLLHQVGFVFWVSENNPARIKGFSTD